MDDEHVAVTAAGQLAADARAQDACHKPGLAGPENNEVDVVLLPR